VLNWIEVENTTATPLFLLDDAAEFQAQMGYDAISWATDDLGDVPARLKTRVKSQGSTFYSWPYACAVVRCDTVEWRPASGPLMVTDGRWGTSAAFEDRIPRTKDRPANVIVPSPQPGTVTLSYERRTITVPFVVTYELNERYDPTVGVPSKECGNGILWGAGLLLLIVSAVVAAPIVIARRFLNARRRARAA
jgi:hypothetical protein